MIRLTPWAAGVHELASRPAVRSRVRGLARPAAHSVSFWAVLWGAAATAGFAALIPVLFHEGAPLTGDEVLHRISGISFMAWGLVAWRRRPDSPIGAVLTITGLGELASAILSQIHSPVAFTAAAWLGEAWIVLFAWLLLTFGSGGRLVRRVDVAIVAIFTIDLVALPLAQLLVLPDPRNLLLAWPDAALARALGDAAMALGAAASLVVVVLIAARWRSASRPRRRALLPSLGGALCALLYATWLTSLVAGSPVVPVVYLLNGALVSVPAALAWGLLRSRLARGDLADLLRELGPLRGVRLEAGLAKVLGDPGLVLAYRVPGERTYLDGRGRAVALPAPGADRAAVSVARDGRELGALIYDAALDDDPELVGAVAAAAAITLDDARMQDESRDRMEELRASRERLVAAGDAERRRLERNLHDGAQQRLVSVALQLRMARSRIATDPEQAAALLDAAGAELSTSLQELRELARGIHPAVLNHGLAAALDSLASRASVPTTVSFDSPGRLPEPVELAAYFVACESLANVAKYARADEASVRVSRRDGVAVIEIADDGVGGADETAGTGLQGLADRVAALDGTLRILSPPGKGTVVTAELPCGS